MWFYSNSFNNNPGMTAVHDDVSRVPPRFTSNRRKEDKEDYTVIHKGRSVMSCHVLMSNIFASALPTRSIRIVFRSGGGCTQKRTLFLVTLTLDPHIRFRRKIWHFTFWWKMLLHHKLHMVRPSLKVVIKHTKCTVRSGFPIALPQLSPVTTYDAQRQRSSSFLQTRD